MADALGYRMPPSGLRSPAPGRPEPFPSCGLSRALGYGLQRPYSTIGRIPKRLAM
jgi:hypothetical protein